MPVPSNGAAAQPHPALGAGRTPTTGRGVGCRRGWAARHATPDCGWEAAAPLRGRASRQHSTSLLEVTITGPISQATCVPSPRNAQAERRGRRPHPTPAGSYAPTLSRRHLISSTRLTASSCVCVPSSFEQRICMPTLRQSTRTSWRPERPCGTVYRPL